MKRVFLACCSSFSSVLQDLRQQGESGQPKFLDGKEVMVLVRSARPLDLPGCTTVPVDDDGFAAADIVIGGDDEFVTEGARNELFVAIMRMSDGGKKAKVYTFCRGVLRPVVPLGNPRPLPSISP